MKFLSFVIGILIFFAFLDFFVAAIKLTLKFYLAIIVISCAIKIVASIFML